MSKILHSQITTHPRGTAPRDMDVAALAIGCVCTEFRVTRKDLEGPSRKWEFVWPRFVAIGLISKHTNLSTKVIALLFNRDYHGIRYTREALQNEVQTNAAHRNQWDRISELFSKEINKDQI